MSITKDNRYYSAGASVQSRLAAIVAQATVETVRGA